MVTLSSYDLACLLKELEFLINSKVDKIYVLPDKSVIFRLHVTGKGSQILRINVPDVMYLTDYKPETFHPKGFCMNLRKHLSQARLRKITQIGFDRVVELEFSTKDNVYFVYIEFFAKGNVLLCDENKKIISVLIPLKTKERKLLGGQVYEFPKSKYNFLNIEKKDIKDMLSSTEQESLVKSLAIEFQLGGNYAEEICFRSNVDKTKLKFTENEFDKIINAIKELQKLEVSPHKYNNKIFPIEMRQFQEVKSEKFESYSKLLDSILTKGIIETQKKEAVSSHDKKVKKIENIVKKQQQQLDKVVKISEEDKRKGDLLYENYAEIKKLLEGIKQARKSHTWDEIKEHLKNNKKIVKIDEKNNEIIVDL